MRLSFWLQFLTVDLVRSKKPITELVTLSVISAVYGGVRASKNIVGMVSFIFKVADLVGGVEFSEFCALLSLKL